MNQNEIQNLQNDLKGFNPLMEARKCVDFSVAFDSSMLEFTHKFGFFLCKLYFNRKNSRYETSKEALSNSQIRNFFGEIKRIQMTIMHDGSDENWSKIKSSFLLVKPKLAYAVGRVLQKNATSAIKDFGEVFSYAIDKVEADKLNAPERFMRFVDFFEAVLAYHRAFGGSEN